MRPEKKRILVICKGHQNIAGAQLYLKQLSSIISPEKYIMHFAFHKGDGTRVFDDIAERLETNRWEFDWRHLPAIESFRVGMKIIRQVNPVLIIFNSSEDKILPVVFAARLCNVPKRVMIVHWAQGKDSLPFFRRKKGIPFAIPSRYSIKMRVLRWLGYGLLTKLVFVNNMTRIAYCELYGIAPKRCVTIYNGIDLSLYLNVSSKRKSIRHALNLKDHECMVFSVGNLTEIKGHKYLISSIKILTSKGLPIKCFIAGDGELKSDLEKQITELGLNNNIRLLGYRDDIPDLLAATDIFCMPSLNEALGYSILEAMAAGVPVIASNVGGIPEVMKNGKEGILVQPSDPEELSFEIENLVLNETMRNAMGKQGQKTVCEFFLQKDMIEKTQKEILSNLQ